MTRESMAGDSITGNQHAPEAEIWTEHYLALGPDQCENARLDMKRQRL
jgi:hypothetical protein